MWPFTNQKSECIFILTPDHLICSFVVEQTNQMPLIKFLETHQLSPYFYADSLIAQSAWLCRIITHFLDTYNLHNHPVRCALSGTAVKQTLTLSHKSSPTVRDFPIPQLRKMIWNSTYLYPTGDNQFAFYVYGFVPQFLFQVRMICHRIPIKNIQVTTTYATLIHAYKALYGAAFRPSQLAIDLEQHNNRLELIFTPDATNRLITLDRAITIEKNSELFIPLIAGLWHMKSSDPLLLKL